MCRTQTTLRHILGGKVLQECIENRDMILQEVQTITSRVANEWGVKVKDKSATLVKRSIKEENKI
jgi:regulator of protease activity HflC (stomatin/prohibitin superfamily)